MVGRVCKCVLVLGGHSSARHPGEDCVRFYLVSQGAPRTVVTRSRRRRLLVWHPPG